MSAPSKACAIQMVKVHRGERLANTPERTFAPGGVTCLREAKGKGLSPVKLHIREADVLHINGRQQNGTVRGEVPVLLAGSETVALYQRDIAGTWENQCIPEMVCGDNPEKGKDSQLMHWWSDKPVVAMKFLNGNGAKGLTAIPLERETSASHRTGEQMETELNPKPLRIAMVGILKSRMREGAADKTAI